MKTLAAVVAAVVLSFVPLPRAAQAQTPDNRLVFSVAPTSVSEDSSNNQAVVTMSCAAGADCTASIPGSRIQISYSGTADVSGAGNDFTAALPGNFGLVSSSGSARGGEALASLTFTVNDDSMAEVEETLAISIAETHNDYSIDGATDFTVTIAETFAAFISTHHRASAKP